MTSVVPFPERAALNIEDLRIRAESLDLKIIEGPPSDDETIPVEYRGSYTLICAQMGYWAHVSGVNLAGLKDQLGQIEREPPYDEAAADRENAEILRALATPNLTVITNGKFIEDSADR